MVFSSLEFIYLFLPPVLLVFFILRSLRLESAIIWWLIAASVAFYMWWSPPHLLLLLGSVAFNYLLHKPLRASRSKLLLAFGITANLCVLGLFKYADFVIGNLKFATGANLSELGLILPLAISFYTFQQISFLRDAYSDKLAQFDFKRYVLFVTFFPQLIAGPIVMQQDTIPQFRISVFRNRSLLNFLAGSTLFFVGLFKKIVLADGIAPTANLIFSMAEAGQAIPVEAAWIGALAYTFQIYFDFSGYCDMALGLALMFGIRLPINFNSPYRALSIVEFWRRWHITLSRFLRDYLYIPLGGNRSGYIGAKGNLMLTMLLGGLWHGAGWNFMIWGGLHGAFLITNHLWSSSTLSTALRQFAGQTIYCFLAWLATMLAVVVAWVFFRSETFAGATHLLSAMTGMTSTIELMDWRQVLTEPNQVLLGLLLMLAIVTIIPNSMELMKDYKPVIASSKEIGKPLFRFITAKWRPSISWALVTCVLGSASLIQIYRLNGLTEFIYFNF